MGNCKDGTCNHDDPSWCEEKPPAQVESGAPYSATGRWLYFNGKAVSRYVTEESVSCDVERFNGIWKVAFSAGAAAERGKLAKLVEAARKLVAVRSFGLEFQALEAEVRKIEGAK